VLLVDDVQFIEVRYTQSFFILLILCMKQSKLVLASDRPPNQIPVTERPVFSILYKLLLIFMRGFGNSDGNFTEDRG